jgi:hypothetical protein
MEGLLPLDESLITEMREAEAVFMHMVTRLEYARVFSYDMRKRMYYTHLRFWNDYLERNHTNLLVSGIMPHEIPDYIIYALCKYKKIPTLMFHATTITDCASLFSDWEVSTPEVRQRFEELQREYAGKSIDQVPLSGRFLEYFNKQTGLQGKTPITFVRPKALQRLTTFTRGHPIAALIRLLRWIPSLFSVAAWRRRWGKFAGRRRLRALQMFYDRTAIVPDLSVKYIYVPLHLQPECSTSPLAGAFVDQVMAVQLLSATAPSDVLLYVKEHPLQRTRGFACRDRKFYQDILAMTWIRLHSVNIVGRLPRVQEHLASKRCSGESLSLCSGTGSINMHPAYFPSIPKRMPRKLCMQYLKKASHRIFLKYGSSLKLLRKLPCTLLLRIGISGRHPIFPSKSMSRRSQMR